MAKSNFIGAPANELARLSTKFKNLGYFFFTMAIVVLFTYNESANLLEDRVFGVTLFLLLGAGLWVVGWVIQGFAKQS